MRRFLAILTVSALMMAAPAALGSVESKSVEDVVAPEPTTTTTKATTTTSEHKTTTTSENETTTTIKPRPTTTTTERSTTTSEPASTTTTPETTTTTASTTTTTTVVAVLSPPAIPPSGSGIRETASGVQADYSPGLFGSMEMGRPEVLGVELNAEYNMAVEVIESSWVWMVGLLVVIAGAIVTGLDRRKTLQVPNH